MRVGVGGVIAAIAILWATIAHAETKPVTIDGAVKQVQQVTSDELRQLPSVERRVTPKSMIRRNGASYATSSPLPRKMVIC
jgi:hypothetical protein